MEAVGELALLLSALVEKCGRSVNSVAQEASVDPAYLWRLMHGQRKKPSRDLLIRIGLVLQLTPGEVDEILAAADYLPLTLRQN